MAASDSDSDLVARCRAGDDSAWQALVERYSRYVHAIAVQAFRLPPDDAEDVFQEVFLRVYEHLGTLRSDEALRPWVAQLTRRCCVDRLRADRREHPEGDAIEVEDADDAISRLDEAFTVRLALEQLSPDCQEVLDRFFCRDQSYRTIGEELALPPGTIASRISRCLGKLRERLEGRNPAPAASSERVSR
ncbi:MAG TPA: sigma-70 family RNA polymerase sigma factor [Gaiellaceae bacterium]|jgi:RNA polymerase sigma-70 factor (ECF subfamily)